MVRGLIMGKCCWRGRLLLDSLAAKGLSNSKVLKSNKRKSFSKSERDVISILSAKKIDKNKNNKNNNNSVTCTVHHLKSNRPLSQIVQLL